MEEIVLDDVAIVAFLDVQKKFEITPIRTTAGYIQFQVVGDGVTEALENLYANGPVAALDYIKSLKALRSSVFVFRGGRK